MTDTNKPENSTNQLEDLNIKKISLEIQIKELELELKKNEIIDKQKESKFKKTVNSSLLIAVIGALIAIFGGLLNSFYQHSNEKDIEQQKLNSSLLLKALETDSKVKSIDNLKFLKKFNLLATGDKVLDSLTNDSTKYYSIPSIYEKNMIIILDSLKTPLPKMDVFYDKIFVGRTDSLGRVEVTDFTYPPRTHDIEVREKGKECTYIDVIQDWRNIIQLRVNRPRP